MGKVQRRGGALTTRSVDNSIVWLPGLGRAASMRGYTTENRGDDSWLNVRRDQKYKAEPNREEQTQRNALKHARQPKL